MERLRLGSKEGKVKTIGALLCVGGALLTALYKGNEFFISNHHSDHHSPIIITPHHHWTRGTIMLLASTLAYSSWFIVQITETITICVLINYVDMYFVFISISDLRPMFEHRLNSLEFRLESSISYYNLLGNISNSSELVLTFMGHISSRPNISTNVQSSCSYFCVYTEYQEQCLHLPHPCTEPP
ncbi:hypothetical protein CsatB_002328 [Cannabis sativa]